MTQPKISGNQVDGGWTLIREVQNNTVNGGSPIFLHFDFLGDIDHNVFLHYRLEIPYFTRITIFDVADMSFATAAGVDNATTNHMTKRRILNGGDASIGPNDKIAFGLSYDTGIPHMFLTADFGLTPDGLAVAGMFQGIAIGGEVSIGGFSWEAEVGSPLLPVTGLRFNPDNTSSDLLGNARLYGK